MKETDRKNNRLILLMLLLPVFAVLISAGCQKKDVDMYKFVATSVTESDVTTENSVSSSESTKAPAASKASAAQTEAAETTAATTGESKNDTGKTVNKAAAKTPSKAPTKAPTKAPAKTTKSAKTAKATPKPKKAVKNKISGSVTKKSTKKTTKKVKKATPTPKPKYTQYLFVGDSRTVGLDEAVSGISSVAKVGAKITYLKSVLANVTKTRGKNVIFNFGVNDLDKYEKYAAVYKSLPKEFIQNNNVIIMSVNPTDGDKYKSWNKDIDKFNKYIKSHLPSGVKYLDTNSTLKKTGFSTRDGCHYKATTYKKIAQLVFNFCGDKNRKP